MKSDRPDNFRTLSTNHTQRSRYNVDALTYPQAVVLTPSISEESETGVRIPYRVILRRNRLFIGVTLVSAALVGAAITFLSTPIYRAHALLEVQGINENFMNIKDLDPSIRSGIPVDRMMETQTALLTSQSVLERTAAMLQLGNHSELFETPTLLQRIGFTSRPARPAALPVDQAAGALAPNIKVKAEGQSSLISVTVDLPDPKMAASVANTLASEYIEQSQSSRWDSAVHTGEWLTRQLEDYRVKLQNSERELQDYARNNGLVFTGEQNNVAEDKLRQIQQELTRAQADRADKQSQLEIASGNKSDSIAKVLDDGTLKEYNSRLADLRRQVAELSSTLTPAHYRVKRVEAQIAEVESTIQRERANIIARIRTDYEAALRRERLLAADYAQQSRTVSDQSVRGIKYNMLKHDLDTNRELYQSMLQKVKEASIVSALKASNLRVVDPARAPRLPFKPDLVKNVAASLLGGGLFSLFVVLLRERNSRTVRMPGDTEGQLNVRELGVIPSGDVDSIPQRGGGPLRSLLNPGAGSDPLVSQLELITWHRKHSMMAEAFRSAMTSFLRSDAESMRPRVLLITSSNPNSGKTLSASNLAIAFAETGQNVLLVDGDLRRPRVHKIFGIANEDGFSDLLAEEKPLDEARIARSVRRTFIPGLHVLPGGSPPMDIARLLHRPKLNEMFTRFRADFDWVLIDAPPVLTLFDSRVLAPLTDGVILVCRAGSTNQEQLMAAWKSLTDDRIPVLGTILNDWNPRTGDPAYYTSYKQYYGAASNRS